MAADLQLIVGLGNPGAGYAANRHNVGFRVVDALAADLGLTFAAGAGRWDEAGSVAGGLVLLKPLTYMNRSGDAVLAWARATGIAVGGKAPSEPAPDDAPPAPAPDPVRPLVVCDDLALPVGAVRLRARGGSGGQNGLASLIARLGGEEFPRLRLGIAPGDEPVPPAAWADYVLEDFAVDEVPAVDDAVAHAVAALRWHLDHGLEAAASRFNRRAAPAGPEA